MPQDFGISWLPQNAPLPNLVGAFAKNNTPNSIPGVQTITFRCTSNEQRWDLEECVDLVSVTWKNLTIVTDDGFIRVSDCPVLTTVSLPVFVTCRNMQITGNSLLTLLDMPALLPGNGVNLDYSGNALSQASVDNALHRCAVSGSVNGTIHLDGGTNSPPSAAGVLDKVTIQGRGWTVTNN